MLHKENPFTAFTLSLVGLLLVTSLTARLLPRMGGMVLEGATLMVLSTFIWGWRREPALARAVKWMLVAFVLAAVWRMVAGDASAEPLLLLVMLVFYSLTLAVAIRRVFQARDVTGDTIVGALAVYLLLALVWALLYQLAIIMGLGSVDPLEGESWFARFNELVYFSFVTLTTLGFGDILPDGALLRFLVYMEATIGQFYIAVLVASLVSKRGSRPVG